MVKMAEAKNIRSKWDSVLDDAARVTKGAAAGLLGGMLASWAMKKYQAIESRPVNVRQGERVLAAMGLVGESLPSASSEAMENSEAIAVNTAQAVSRKLFDHELSPQQEKLAGPAVKYGLGAAAGAIYGGLAEMLPAVSTGMGIPYATALWLGADEIVVPALGLSKPPTASRPAIHASQLATHFVYGITLDISRRILRRLL